MNIPRNKDGTFLRTIKAWTPKKWNMGYFDNRGRFRVYRPDCPRSYADGYALRAHVVWWLRYGKPHPKNTELHHKDRDKSNDKIWNLEVLTKSEHRSEHQENWIHLICEHCGNAFKEHAWRNSAREKEGRKIRFCSQKCFQEHPRSQEHKIAISRGMKLAYVEGRR